MNDTTYTQQLAGKLYEAYCAAVGGKAFNGDTLPSWETFRADPAKQKQSDAWLVVARTAYGELVNTKPCCAP